LLELLRDGFERDDDVMMVRIAGTEMYVVCIRRLRRVHRARDETPASTWDYRSRINERTCDQGTKHNGERDM
jgi:hypothetical protein